MSTPPNQSSPPPVGMETPGMQAGRIEGIKQYYQQLCTSYRLTSQQLQSPELSPPQRQQLQLQLEKLQQGLQEFTEKVIKPIIAANKAAGGTMGFPGMPLPMGPGMMPMGGMMATPVMSQNMANGPMIRAQGMSAMSVMPTQPAVTAMPMTQVPVMAQTQPMGAIGNSQENINVARTPSISTFVPPTVTPMGSANSAPSQGAIVTSPIGTPQPNPLHTPTANVAGLAANKVETKTLSGASASLGNSAMRTPAFATILRSQAQSLLMMTQLRPPTLLSAAEEIDVNTARAHIKQHRAVDSHTVSHFAQEAMGAEVAVSECCEEIILALADRCLGEICEGLCEHLRQRKQTQLSLADLEAVIGREVGSPVTVAALPFAIPPPGPVKVTSKKNTPNSHNARLLQLKKHIQQIS